MRLTSRLTLPPEVIPPAHRKQSPSTAEHHNWAEGTRASRTDRGELGRGNPKACMRILFKVCSGRAELQETKQKATTGRKRAAGKLLPTRCRGNRSWSQVLPWGRRIANIPGSQWHVQGGRPCKRSGKLQRPVPVDSRTYSD